MNWISDEQQKAILRVPHFGQSHYASWDLNDNLDFYMFHFVEPYLARPEDAGIRVVADVGAGYGWLAIAFALRTRLRIVAIDVNAPRLVAAERIARILGVADRIDWRVGAAGSLPLGEQEADLTYCIEVVEHTGKDPGVIRDLGRVTRGALVITSPNRLFPVIGHDTCLPFCHWLPLPMRDLYASLFGRKKYQDGNLFWSPGELAAILADFERISSFFQFADYNEYARAARALAAEQRAPRSRSKAARDRYYRLASLAGRSAVYILPNLASTFRRRDGRAA
jgi:SAM-dependent methyltransferase